MIDLANPALEKAINLLSGAAAEMHGFVVEDHSVELFGLCRACAQKS
jgi:Fe2+ or Zn2+ uptake regulation protein